MVKLFRVPSQIRVISDEAGGGFGDFRKSEEGLLPIGEIHKCFDAEMQQLLSCDSFV